MNNNRDDIDLIEKYFDNALTAAEVDTLHNRLRSDESLKKLYNQENALVNAIRFNAAKRDLTYLQDLEKNLSKQGRSIQTKLWYYAAAACITLLVLAGIFLPLGNPAPEKLYADYFEPYPNVFEPITRGEITVTSRTEAFHAYDQGNYEKAAQLFTALLKENNESGMLLLLGNANLMTNNTSSAMENFTTLMRDFDDHDLEAKWYLSLCYLKTGNTTEAVKLWEQLGKTEIRYASKANELLKKVE